MSKAQGNWKGDQRFEGAEPNNRSLAEQLGLSERQLYRVVNEGTANRSIAERVAEAKGGHAIDYLRAPKPLGRPRKHAPMSFLDLLQPEKFKFSDFTSDELKAIHAGKSPRVRGLPVVHALIDNETISQERFHSFEHFVGVIEAAEVNCSMKDAREIWTRFKLWCLEQQYIEARFTLELGDAV